MEFKTFTAGTDDEGRRLDRVASRIMEGAGIRKSLFAEIRKGLVRVNERKSKPDQHINSGDKISIAAFLFSTTREESKVQAASRHQEPQVISGEELKYIEENTLFRNSHLLILNKKAGISVQPSKGSGKSLSQMVESLWQQESHSQSLSFRPGPLHRIDRWTSGAIVFSQSLEGAKWFTKAMAEHKIKKTYIAVTEGFYGSTTEDYEDLILSEEKALAEGGFSTVKVYPAQHQPIPREAKKAITHARILQQRTINGRELSLVEFTIETGRKHQIRAQSAFHGHPLYGDTAYGGRKNAGDMFFLHAYKLEFPGDNPMEASTLVTAPLSDIFLDFVLLNFKNAL